MSIDLRCRHDRSLRELAAGMFDAGGGLRVRRQKLGHPRQGRAEMAADVPGRWGGGLLNMGKTHATREPWQCHTSNASCAGTVAVPHITRVLWALAPVHYTSVSSSSSPPVAALRAGCRVASASKSFFARSRLPTGEAIR